MSKVKAFFKKIGAYIKNTAWIQPILIVIIIFVVLFSLNPITEAIKTGWKKITTVNKMEKITYGEYVEMVKSQEEDEKFVVIFTDKECEICADLYKSVNVFLKSDEYKDGDFKIYNVDLSTRSVKEKIDGKKYVQYKDNTLDLLASPTESNEKILDRDYLRQLDERIGDFVSSFGDEGYTGLNAASNDSYVYVATPLIVWYEGGLETRISNTWSFNKDSSASEVRKYLSDFEGDKVAESWVDSFELSYNKD